MSAMVPYTRDTAPLANWFNFMDELANNSADSRIDREQDLCFWRDGGSICFSRRYGLSSVRGGRDPGWSGVFDGNRLRIESRRGSLL